MRSCQPRTCSTEGRTSRDERGIGAVVGISEVAKRLGVPKKALPLVDLGLGVVWSAVMDTGPVLKRILAGLVIGASAGGAWDAGKSVVRVARGKALH